MSWFDPSRAPCSQSAPQPLSPPPRARSGTTPQRPSSPPRAPVLLPHGPLRLSVQRTVVAGAWARWGNRPDKGGRARRLTARPSPHAAPRHNHGPDARSSPQLDPGACSPSASRRLPLSAARSPAPRVLSASRTPGARLPLPCPSLSAPRPLSAPSAPPQRVQLDPGAEHLPALSSPKLDPGAPLPSV